MNSLEGSMTTYRRREVLAISTFHFFEFLLLVELGGFFSEINDGMRLLG